MTYGIRHRQLLQAVYDDALASVAVIGRDQGILHPRANMLEFVPLTESFYNVSGGLPTNVPTAMPRNAPRGTSLATKTLKREAFLVRSALTQLAPEVEQSFASVRAAMQHDAWFPAVLSPEIGELIDAWSDWFEDQMVHAELHPAPSPTSLVARQWLELSRLLLAITPQPARDALARGGSAAVTIYRHLAAKPDHWPSPDAGDEAPSIDSDHFLLPTEQEDYKWRFAGKRGGRQGQLRDLLELLHLVPLSDAERGRALKKAVDFVSGRRAWEGVKSRLTALGGPLVHLGQLEGLVYLAAQPGDGYLDHNANERLKQVAIVAAARCHRVREQVVRDILLGEIQRGRVPVNTAPAFMVLRQVPKFLSVVGAACVELERRTGAPRAGLVLRLGQPGGQLQMWHRTEIQAEDPGLAENLRRQAVAALAQAPTGSYAVCLEPDAAVSRRLLNVVAKGKGALWARHAGAVAVIQVEAPGHDVARGTLERWAFVLVFREPPEPRSPTSTRAATTTSLSRGVRQMQLELEALVDFVSTAARSMRYSVVLGQTAHALVGPATRAVTLADLLEVALQREGLSSPIESFVALRGSVRRLAEKARAAKAYFGGRPAKSEPVALNPLVRDAVAEAQTRFGRVAFREDPDLVVRGDAGLIRIVLEQLLDNAGEAMSASGARSPGLVVKARRVGAMSTIEVTNPSRAESREALEQQLGDILRNAELGVPNSPRHSGGTGLGLLYCVKMLKDMGGSWAFKVTQRGKQLFVITTASLPASR